MNDNQRRNLIALVQNHPFLWYTWEALYKEDREEIWKYIGAQLSPPVEGTVARDELRELILTFSQLYKHQKKSEVRSRSTPHEILKWVYQPTWPFYNSLMFLENRLPLREAVRRIIRGEDDYTVPALPDDDDDEIFWLYDDQKKDLITSVENNSALWERNAWTNYDANAATQWNGIARQFVQPSVTGLQAWSIFKSLAEVFNVLHNLHQMTGVKPDWRFYDDLMFLTENPQL